MNTYYEAFLAIKRANNKTQNQNSVFWNDPLGNKVGSQRSEEAKKDHQMLNRAAENLVSLHTEIFRGQAQ